MKSYPLAAALTLILATVVSPVIAQERDSKSFHIDISYLLTCDDSGQITLIDPPTLPGQGRQPPRQKVNGHLGSEAVQKAREAAAQFVKNPPPFFVGIGNIGDQMYVTAAVHSNNVVRLSCVGFAPAPPELLAFRKTMSEVVSAAQVDPGHEELRSHIAQQLLETRINHFEMRRGVLTVPNDDPAALIDKVANQKELQHERIHCLRRIAGIDGLQLGDRFYELSRPGRSDFDDDDRFQILEMSLQSGSIKGFVDYPRDLHELLSSNIERFPSALNDSIRERLDEPSVKKLATAIGEPDISYRNAMKAWDWMASHTDRLKFDPHSHQFQIVDSK